MNIRFSQLRHRRFWKRGAAVTEFAIVSVVLVSIIMWSHFFYDLVEAKLKTQEMARYAVWEFAGYQLSDHLKTKHNDLYKNASDAIKKDTEDRFKDLISTQAPGQTVKDGEKRFTLDVGQVSSNLSKQSDFITSIMNRWKFNNIGSVTSNVSTRVTNLNKVLPRTFLEGSKGWFKARHQSKPSYNFRETAMLLVDPWALNEGPSVVFGTGNYGKTELVAVVGRMDGVTGALGASELRQVTNILGKVTRVMIGIDPLATRVASQPYGDSRNVKGQPPLLSYPIDRGAKNFHTINFCTSNSQYSGKGKCTGGTSAAFYKRGPYFMGCKKDQEYVCDYK
ncbi:MAG: hypothetical protein GMKNLPBB_00183 [Myxococcota bacterium]|nr:hypothetical protein [Myxococcota bacterium]